MMWSNSVRKNLLLHVLCVNNISQWIYSRHSHLYYFSLLFFLLFVFLLHLLLLLLHNQPSSSSAFQLLPHKSFVCRFQNHFVLVFFICFNPVNSEINVIRCTIKAENCVKCHIKLSIDIMLGIYSTVEGSLFLLFFFFFYFCWQAFVTYTWDIKLV